MYNPAIHSYQAPIRLAFTGAKTNEQLIAAVVDKVIVIDKIVLSAAALSATAFTFATGAAHTVIGPILYYAYESISIDLHLRLPSGQNFEYTGPGTCGFYIEYHYESGSI